MKNTPKQIIIIRGDLDISKGKLLTQAAHASSKIIIKLLTENLESKVFYEWSDGIFKKIILKVKNELELFKIYEKIKDAGYVAEIVKDIGLNEFSKPTYTAIGVEPLYPEEIDPIVKKLRAY